MITFQGTGARCCDRVDRREFLKVGGLGLFGLTAPELLRLRAASSAATGSGKSFGRAKQVILLFMVGGPPHQDTFDLKPNAQADIRGEFRPISTTVPGMQICEHLPGLASLADRYAVIRSVTHPSNAHSASAHHMLTGNIHPNPAGENLNPSTVDYPFLGSVLTKLRPSTSRLPTAVALPWKVHNTGGQFWPGQGGGFLGAGYDPFRVNIKFERLTNDVQKYENLDFSVTDLVLPEGVSLARMQARRSLLDSASRGFRALESLGTLRDHDSYYHEAFDLVASPEAQSAFALNREPAPVRDRYGNHIFGQGVLLARRLAQAGVPLVTVYWHQDGNAQAPAWDTHEKNFKNLKERLLPPTDRALSALLQDMSGSGLLDETLVVWMGEFGRTPKVNQSGGRDHWGACQAVLLAGAGVRGGHVLGASDDQAAYPASDPVAPADLIATIYHLLGINHETEIHDQLDRPQPLCRGRVLEELF